MKKQYLKVLLFLCYQRSVFHGVVPCHARFICFFHGTCKQYAPAEHRLSN